MPRPFVPDHSITVRGERVMTRTCVPQAVSGRAGGTAAARCCWSVGRGGALPQAVIVAANAAAETRLFKRAVRSTIAFRNRVRIAWAFPTLLRIALLPP